MSNLTTLVIRDTRNLIIRPTFLFYVTFFPLALIGLLGLLGQGFYGPAMTSWDVGAVNILLYTASLSCAMSVNSFLERTLKAPNLRVLFSPVSPFDLILSKVIGSTLFCLGGYAIVFAILQVLGVRLGPVWGLEFFGIIAALSFASSALGLWVVCLVRSEPVANQILNLIIGALACTGGVFFNIEHLGTVGALLARLSPFTWIREVAFRTIWNGDPAGYALSILILLATTAVFIVAARLSFKTEDFV